MINKQEANFSKKGKDIIKKIGCELVLHLLPHTKS